MVLSENLISALDLTLADLVRREEGIVWGFVLYISPSSAFPFSFLLLHLVNSLLLQRSKVLFWKGVWYCFLSDTEL